MEDVLKHWRQKCENGQINLATYLNMEKVILRVYQD